jgi:alanine-glyoxylate transaminase/serine-glyoxylate transaminase/serine-pyruvate transaminase
MLAEEGLPAVFARHARYAEATRRAVRGWGLEIVGQDPGEYSNTLTAVIVPDGHDADQIREIILDRFNMSLGAGLGRLAGRVFRIGHLGDLGDLSLAGVLCGVEMGLTLAAVPISRDGVRAAIDYLTQTA